jgi:Predicted signal transduction protein with a C-terminal ATPase domain
LEGYSDKFYQFEVNKKIKNDISAWCGDLQKINYTSKLDLISALNETISMDKNINSMEIYNFAQQQVLVAKRSGAGMEEIGYKLDDWKKRDQKLQTNIIFSRTEKEIIVSHEIFNFSDKKPMVLIAMHLRPYDMEGILEDIKTTKDESILIFNDENELIQAEYGAGVHLESSRLTEVIQQLEKAKVQETFLEGHFYFFREVGQGKMKILMTVPNRTIVAALGNTIVAGILVGLVAVIVSALGSMLFSRAFSKPIIDLSAQMRIITIDDYPDIAVQERKDEIGILHDSFGIMLERNKKLIEQEYQSKIEKREAQLRALQAQINPHFMYNTLQVIGGMALKKESSKVYKVTTALGDIMRYSLNFSDEMVCLREEIQYFQAYLTIQNERFGNKINLEIDVPEALEDCIIPKLILQPLLENSMEHGLSDRVGQWLIRLKGTIQNKEDLLLTLEDNGIGISPQRLEQIRESLKNETEKTMKAGSHIGLCNVNTRIRLKFSEDRYGISIDSKEGEGTTVKVRIKVIRRDDSNGKI